MSNARNGEKHKQTARGAHADVRDLAHAPAPGKQTRAESTAYHGPVVSTSAPAAPSPQPAAASLEAWDAYGLFAAAAGLHDSQGDSAPAAPAARPPSSAISNHADPGLAQATALIHQSLAHLQVMQTSLLTAYHAAVAAFDAAGTRAIAAQLVAGLLQMEHAQEQVSRWAPHATGELAQLRAQLASETRAAVASLAVQLSPQMLAWAPVAGTIEPPSRGKVAHLGAELVAQEAAMVVVLLEAADHIAALAAPQGEASSLPASPDDLRRAVDEFERFQSRPIHAAFLAEVLRRRGVWPDLAQARSNRTNQTADGLLRGAQAQAMETGATADVGQRWNPAKAEDALTYGLADWAITDEDAMEVIEMLRWASPEARGGLVKQLHKRGLLARVTSNVGWQYVKAIAETLNDPEAEALLAPYWEGKGGVPSLGQLLTKQVQDNRQQGGLVNDVQAFAWETLNNSLDVFTLGAKPALDAAHEALDAGWISADAYSFEASKTEARAIVTAAAMAATGGLAGAWTEGAALTLGAGEGGSSVLSAAMGGAVGNTAGQLAGDTFDQAFSGKQGFDSLGSYAQTFAQGGLFGAALAPVGLAAAKYLPATMRTIAQDIAAHHPEMVGILEAAKTAGAGAAFRVRVTVREWLDITKGGGGSGGMFAGGLQPVFATAGISPDLSALPPDSELWITARPKVELNALASHLGDSSGPYFELDAIDAEPRAGREARPPSGSLFDDHGANANYTDDPFEHRQDLELEPRFTDADTDASHVLAERGTTALNGNRLGISRPPRHHLLPQSEIAYFQQRGFPGRDIDAYCIVVSQAEHEIIHGGGSRRLAAKHWQHREWNSALMRRLRQHEARLVSSRGIKAKLDRATILEIVDDLRRLFKIADHPIVQYAD